MQGNNTGSEQDRPESSQKTRPCIQTTADETQVKQIRRGVTEEVNRTKPEKRTTKIKQEES